ncbi:MAG: BON domain-containing protein [Gemmatimonadota bacterium]
MKTDAQIREEIFKELKWEPTIRDIEIGVSVKDGVATLSGNVRTFAQKFAADRAAERVAGVQVVADELNVKLTDGQERSDTEIAHAVANVLKWDSEVPDAVKARVDNGWIWLEGDVEWQFQKEAAERAIRYLTGVRGVTNTVRIKPTLASPVEVSKKIKEALVRGAQFDADRIVVEAQAGKITLRGTVRSYAERKEAERAAWSAPGVTDVEDKIAIGV